MTTATQSDIESAVEFAFEELDCCSQRKHELPCSGPIRGFQEHHDCVQGWLCETHWNHAIQVVLPAWKAQIVTMGFIGCLHCAGRFTDIRKLVRYFPIGG